MPACCDRGFDQAILGRAVMADPWRNYDRWKLRSPEDEEDEGERDQRPDDVVGVREKRIVLLPALGCQEQRQFGCVSHVGSSIRR